MKLAIPAEDNRGIDTKVCVSFGRTPYFLIYDTETKEVVFLENSAASSSGGAGIKAAQFVCDAKADAVITYRCGENAANVLKEAGAIIYKAVSETVEENINLYIDKKLSELNEIHAGFHDHGK